MPQLVSELSFVCGSGMFWYSIKLALIIMDGLGVESIKTEPNPANMTHISFTHII